MEKVEALLKELDIHKIESLSEVTDGADSSVWKVQTPDNTYALRILPIDRHAQFLSEYKTLDLAFRQGIPVPKVYKVIAYAGSSAMLMEWAKGITVLQALQTYPEKARSLGIKFGEMHASIHKCTVMAKDVEHMRDWISPSTDEETDAMKAIIGQTTEMENVLLHLDYHPLNVLTDGDELTAVIDWANASSGDARFDYARTKAILQLEGPKACVMMDIAEETLKQFEQGWEQGYEHAAGHMNLIPLFNVWAGHSMIRDLSGKRSEVELLMIRKWIETWKD